MFINLYKEIIKGRTLARAMMNLEMSQYELKGKVLDLGGGKNSEYTYCFQRNKDLELVNIDCDAKDENARIDFEKDRLPFDDGELDQIVVLNLLEHIYNYKFLISEVKKALKNGGVVYGFVPFLVNYHPDPHDFFRYTNEALEKIFKEAGFSEVNIKPVGRGPFGVNFNNIVLSVPKWMRILLFPQYYLMDTIFIKLRPKIILRYPLGYKFILKK